MRRNENNRSAFAPVLDSNVIQIEVTKISSNSFVAIFRVLLSRLKE